MKWLPWTRRKSSTSSLFRRFSKSRSDDEHGNSFSHNNEDSVQKFSSSIDSDEFLQRGHTHHILNDDSSSLASHELLMPPILGQIKSEQAVPDVPDSFTPVKELQAVELSAAVQGRILVEALPPLFDEGHVLQYRLSNENFGDDENLVSVITAAASVESRTQTLGYIRRHTKSTHIHNTTPRRLIRHHSHHLSDMTLHLHEPNSTDSSSCLPPVALMQHVSPLEYRILGSTPLTFWDTPCYTEGSTSWYPWFRVVTNTSPLDREEPRTISIWDGQDYAASNGCTATAAFGSCHMQVTRNENHDVVMGQILPSTGANDTKRTLVTIPPGADPAVLICLSAILQETVKL